MKLSAACLLCASALLARLTPAFGVRLQESPVGKVVGLITQLKATIESEGKKEQKSYDKYACWCEATLARKAKAIADAKETIDESQATILKLKGALASHGAEIKQLEKDIAENLQSQQEATEVRNKENAAYEEEKSESEQCVGALESAITVLSGAGAGKKGAFLATMQDAQLLSVAAGVSKVLAKDAAVRYAEEHDVQALRNFLARPADFASAARHANGGFSAAQVGNNPFGDYAPQSTQIQGILKGMYDAFAGDIEQGNGEEAGKQKSYEELMATKKDELATLQETLERHQSDEADKTKKLAETTTLRDDTKAQLKADEVFFEDTQQGCRVKSEEWSVRSRLRTKELVGIAEAEKILTSPEAQTIFANASTTLLQLSAAGGTRQSRSASAYQKLRSLAARFGSASLGRIAVAAKAGGHFDKVITMIDNMIGSLREEEQEDIAHRDRCQGAAKKNKNELEDLDHTKTKTQEDIKRMEGVEDKLEAKTDELKDDIKDSKTELREMAEMRHQENAQFKQALKDDDAAVKLLQTAIVALNKFYKNNQKTPESFLQQEPDREYSVDKDKAPETSWEGGDYGGKQSLNTGITSTLEMIAEDLTKEMETARAEEAEAQKSFEEDKAAAREVLRSQKETLVATETSLAELEEKMADKKEFLAQTEADIGAHKELQNTLKSDCAWVETHFESRRTKRKAEIDGLTEAKAILAGVENGDYDELELSSSQ
mmetsp:Transcript_76986/g.198252  ORF Transcript_76986/g.198252 Transcript_76986/m.198252 type:complete len:720 (+) Transcript_76986:66-2225(+)